MHQHRPDAREAVDGARATTAGDTAPACEHACADFRRSRRRFLQGMTAVAGGVAFESVTGGVFRQVAYAATGAAQNVLVVLSLRGGADGLSLVVPHGDPAYQRLRPRIHVPTSTLLAKDGMFGLHPGFAPLEPMWTSGRFAAVHAVGLARPNRSHFAAMEEMEDADPGSRARRGWLNRMIGLDASENPLEAVHLGSATVPTSLYGAAPVVAASRLSQLRLGGADSSTMRRQKARSLHRSWDGAGGELGRAARSALRTVGRVEHLATTTASPANGAVYPAGSSLGQTLADTARLLRADVGVDTVTLDYGSWDMHVNLGDVDNGAMRTMVAELGGSLAAFFTDLGPLAERVTVVTVSEFGRRAEENGNRGLDHGYGNVMLLLGAGVQGGRVYGTWPGLADAHLVEGDLAVTNDYRSVLTEVLRSRFPQVSTSRVFPGFVAEAVGAMR